MKWYGYSALVLCTALVTTASSAEPNQWAPQETSSRRTADQSVVHVATTEPFYNNAYNGAANIAPGVGGWGLGGGGFGGKFAGGFGYAGYGGPRDLSGWNNCESTPPCTSHLWSGYMQRPRRCDYPQQHGGCSTCAPTACAPTACNSCAQHCGPSLLTRIFAKLKSHCPTCSSCSKSANCDSCSAPISLGCSKGVEFAPSSDNNAPPAPEPVLEEEQSDDSAAYRLQLPSLRSSRPAIGSGLK